MSAVEPAEAAAVERVRLRRVSATFGFADVRLPGVHLCGFRVEEHPSGRLIIQAPQRQDGQGRTWPVCTLQPLWREAIEAEIACLWART